MDGFQPSGRGCSAFGGTHRFPERLALGAKPGYAVIINQTQGGKLTKKDKRLIRDYLVILGFELIIIGGALLAIQTAGVA